MNRRIWTALVTALLTVLGLTSSVAHGRPAPDTGTAAEQVLTWTAGNDITKYTSAPATAVAGKATIVFENSEATGNTTAMPHTLTFDVSDPEYNNDVPLNILANPLDANGGRHTAEVTLTPGRYRYYCTIPGHGEMEGILTVTDGGQGEDTTAPETSATVEGEKNSDGNYVGRAKVTVTATDDDSGVERIEYSLDGGPYLAYTAPVTVDRVGRHTIAHRATDKAGNTSGARQVAFTVVEGGGVPGPACPEWDERLTVIVGTVDTGVPNRVTGNRCTINERIEDEKDWASHALFRKHVAEVTDALLDEGVIDKREHTAINKAAKQSGIGKPGQNQGYRDLFDGTRKSFERWQHVGGGAFGLNDDGTITSSTTVPGMGMLWFPERRYDDFSLKLQFRDDAPGTGRANSGVFVRFPDVHDHPEESRPEWVAIKYGHEVQILDRPDGDQYKTGSVYGFDRVGLGGAGVTEKGTWNDYEIRVVGQHYSVFRNGVLINEFDNVGGQEFSPPRADDPGTDGRRYASGHIGLQTHGTTDVISFRNIRIKEL